MSFAGGCRDNQPYAQSSEQGDLSLPIMTINHSFTVRSIYLEPREAIPYPGTEYFPSYDFSSHLEYPIKKEPKEEVIGIDETPLYGGYNLLFEEESTREASSRIQCVAPPIDELASLEASSSQPIICPLTSNQNNQLLLPKPNFKPYIHSGNIPEENSNPIAQRILKILTEIPPLEDKSSVLISDSYPTVFHDNPGVPLPSFNSFYQPTHFSESEAVPHFNPQTTTIQQKEMTITQSNSFYQFPDTLEKKTSLKKRANKKSKDANAIQGIVPSPTCSSLGLSQMKALYNSIYRKRQRGSLKNKVISSGSISSGLYITAPRHQDQQVTKPQKKPRTIFSDSQSEGMLRVFRQNPYISSEQKTILSKHLEMSEKNISIWFKNRRSKLKKMKSSH
uniref:Homeobox protein Ht-En n=1 Tax=Caligus clemensi TaxID=344056 RepID=C1C0J2_CALCM|nr:Homeobox protein Ht-En [Caligus clemensi]